MRNTWRWNGVVLCVASILLLWAMPIVHAQTGDPVASKLAAARTRYESEMAAVRTTLREAMERREAELRSKDQPNLADIDGIVKQKAALGASGQWPAALMDHPARQRAAAAAKALTGQYEQATKAYIKAGDDEHARATDAEREQFLTQNDLIEWGDNRLKPANSGDQVTLDSKTPLDVGEPGATEYRLEIIGMRKSGDGNLTIDLPASGAARARLNTVPDASGHIHAIVSVRKALVSLDLGVGRAAADKAAPAGAKPTVALRVDAGVFELTSVRMKPIIAGAPEQVAQPKEKEVKRDQPARATAAEFMPKKSSWRGKCTPQVGQAFDITMAVTQSTPEQIIMHSDWLGTGGLEFKFAANGTTLELNGVRPTGSRGGIYSEVKGSGRVGEDGFSTSYSWRIDNGKQKGKLVSGTMILKKE